MTHSFDIDRIVRDVLQRLREPLRTDGAAAAAAGDAGTTTSIEASTARRGASAVRLAADHADGRATEAESHGTLAIADRVVSLRQVEGQLEGVRRLRVPLAAVVTPSVRDLLRQKRIELLRSDPDGEPAATTSVWAALDLRRGGAAAIDSRLLDFLPGVRRLASADLGATLSLLAKHLAVSSAGAATAGGVLVSGRSVAATALANRHRSLRAAAVRDLADIESAVRQLGANLLVIDATAGADVVRAACAALLRGVPTAPDWWPAQQSALEGE